MPKNLQEASRKTHKKMNNLYVAQGDTATMPGLLLHFLPSCLWSSAPSAAPPAAPPTAPPPAPPTGPYAPFPPFPLSKIGRVTNSDDSDVSTFLFYCNLFLIFVTRLTEFRQENALVMSSHSFFVLHRECTS